MLLHVSRWGEASTLPGIDVERADICGMDVDDCTSVYRCAKHLEQQSSQCTQEVIAWHNIFSM